jgi:hypothetical protein
MFPIIFRVALLALFGFVIYKIIGLVFNYSRGSGTGLKCEKCRFCELVDDDGVLCRYGDVVVLKTIANVKMCQDFQS